MKIEAYISTGNSFPVIVLHEGRRYFVKLRAGMSGKYGLINEWLGNQLGYELGLPTQLPHWIEFTEDISTENIYIEVRELVAKRLGRNIGFAYQADVIDLKEHDLPGIPEQLLLEIYLFDLMMINVDRTPANLNLMKSRGEIFSVDYEASLLVQGIMECRDFLRNPSILQCLRNNPLYQEIDDETIDQFIAKIRQVAMDDILAPLRRSLLTERDYQHLLESMEAKQTEGWSLKEIRNKLKDVDAENPEEQKNRRRKNQAEFRSRMKN